MSCICVYLTAIALNKFYIMCVVIMEHEYGSPFNLVSIIVSDLFLVMFKGQGYQNGSSATFNYFIDKLGLYR